jgi:hypothetical protein
MICVGIDPDVKKSGFAIWDTINKQLNEYGCKDFFLILCLIENYKSNYPNIKIIIEAGWLNEKSNFHTSKNQTKQAGERIAKNVGANHQIGKLFEEFCIKNDINYKLALPKKSKTSRDMFKAITGLDVKNQDVIDAIMLVWGL